MGGGVVGDSEEKRAQPGVGLNLGGGEGRGANGAENMCGKEVGAPRGCDFTESKKTGKQRSAQQLLLLTHKRRCLVQCASLSQDMMEATSVNTA